MAKPIPSYQVYKGTVFQLVDQAVDFVLSKISLAVGTRAVSTQAPVSYELPPDAVREAVVNAVAHRDYISTASVQVMLFADRLEVWNPGSLPSALTPQKLREPHGSFPANPLLAEPLYLAKYIERMGTGTRDMIRLCRAAGLREPEYAVRDGFVQTLWRPLLSKPTRPTPEVTPEVAGLLRIIHGERSRAELMARLGLKDEKHFREHYQQSGVALGLLEMTRPDAPQSRLQKYRLTEKGRAWLAAQHREREK